MSKLQQNPMFVTEALINGQWVDSLGEHYLEVINPSTQELMGKVPVMNDQQVHDAIQSCTGAFNAWRTTLARERSDILLRWSELLLENKKNIAEILTTEQGKVLAEAEGEVAYAASYLRWFSEEAVRNYGDIIPAALKNQSIKVSKYPVGVCAAITPWNFPIAMLARKVAAAIAAGCTMVAKPSNQTPFSALALAKLGLEAGLPKGVFNIVLGESKKIGELFCSSAQIKKISFTGSTEVGKLLMKRSADNLHKLSLELGGNAPFIVFDDANVEAAVEGLVAAKFRNSGQTCICVNRLFVQRDIYSNFMEALKNKMETLKVGDGFTDVHLGPLINQAAVEKFNIHLANALDHGAELILGGKHSQENNFVKPTLLANANHQMQFCCEESFAPILAAIPFDTDDQALNMANDTEYGLAGYAYTENRKRIHKIENELEVGMLGVNAANLSNASAPFGGIKHSGFGREGSKYGLDDYTETKYVLESFS